MKAKTNRKLVHKRETRTLLRFHLEGFLHTGTWLLPDHWFLCPWFPPCSPEFVPPSWFQQLRSPSWFQNQACTSNMYITSHCVCWHPNSSALRCTWSASGFSALHGMHSEPRLGPFWLVHREYRTEIPSGWRFLLDCDVLHHRSPFCSRKWARFVMHDSQVKTTVLRALSRYRSMHTHPSPLLWNMCIRAPCKKSAPHNKVEMTGRTICIGVFGSFQNLTWFQYLLSLPASDRNDRGSNTCSIPEPIWSTGQFHHLKWFWRVPCFEHPAQFSIFLKQHSPLIHHKSDTAHNCTRTQDTRP